MSANIRVLISEGEIDRRLNEIAAEIMRDFEGKEVMLVCVLKGASIFMVDLARKITGKVASVTFDFMDVSSYGSATVSKGIVKIDKDLTTPITDKHVLLVEDIIDTGQTLNRLIEYLKTKQPASLKTCVLLDKPERRVAEANHITPDYIGFKIPNEFVVGYGLDYDELYRNLPYVGVVSL